MLDATSSAPAAATLPLFVPQAPPDKVSGLIHTATLLAQLLGQGRAVDSRALRSAIETAFCGSDAEGTPCRPDPNPRSSNSRAVRRENPNNRTVTRGTAGGGATARAGGAAREAAPAAAFGALAPPPASRSLDSWRAK
jgi:hypothetical protein